MKRKFSSLCNFQPSDVFINGIILVEMKNANLHSIFYQANLVKPILRAAIAVAEFHTIDSKRFTNSVLIVWKNLKLCNDSFRDDAFGFTDG